MRPLSPSLRAAAELLATGQILLCAPSEPARVEVLADLPPEPRSYGITCDADYFKSCTPYTLTEKPKEPWRRGRPLR